MPEYTLVSLHTLAWRSVEIINAHWSVFKLYYDSF